MPRYHFEDMDEMAEDYEMGDVEDEMYEEFQGSVMGYSDSDDEEYGLLVCLYLLLPFLVSPFNSPVVFVMSSFSFQLSLIVSSSHHRT